MDEPGPRHDPARHIAGSGGVLRALRNLGLLGHVSGWGETLESFETADGARIAVRVMGPPPSAERPAVVFAHGLGCSHGHWMPVARRVARHRRVLAWDARGHGRSIVPAGVAIDLQHISRDLAAMLDHHGLEQVVLVGHSMGALAVMRYLHDHGNGRVAALVLVDQSPRIVTDDLWRLGMFGHCSAAMLLDTIALARRDLADTVLREIEGAGSAWWRARLAPDAALGRLLRRWLGRIDAAPLLDLAESLARADFRALIPRLDMPLHVVLGGRSAHYGNVPLAGYYRQTVPHASIAVYPKAGHSPHVSEPRRFADDLLGFLADHA